MKVGVIGAGRMGRTHVEALRALGPAVRVVSVADVDDTASSEDDLTASANFNHDGVSHHAQTVGLKHQNAPLRDIDGKPIGKTVSGATIRMEGLEAVPSAIGTAAACFL